MYNEKVREAFAHPKNVGFIEDADGVGKVGNATCGDIMEISLKIKDDVIVDAKFRTFGCAAAIATSSTATEMVKGMTIDEALKLTNLKRYIAAYLQKRLSKKQSTITETKRNKVKITTRKVFVS